MSAELETEMEVEIEVEMSGGDTFEIVEAEPAIPIAEAATDCDVDELAGDTDNGSDEPASVVVTEDDGATEPAEIESSGEPGQGEEAEANDESTEEIDENEEIGGPTEGEPLNRWAERVYHQQEQALKIEVADLALEQAKSKANAKAVTALYTDRLEALEKLVEEGWQAILDRRIRAMRAAGNSTSTTGDCSTNVGEFNGDGATIYPASGERLTVDSEACSEAISNAWRDCTIAELGAHGLSRSLIAKLVENEIDTIGKLEDLRADIAQGRGKFGGKWPKGVGEAKITSIEDAVIGWLTKNRDSAVFDAAGLSAGNSNDASDAAAPDFSGSPVPEYPTAEEWDFMATNEVKIWLSDRAKTVHDGRDFSKFAKVVDSGEQAACVDWTIDECPYVPGPECDAWLFGYARKRDQLNPPKEAKKRGRKPKAEAAVATPAPAMPNVPEDTADDVAPAEATAETSDDFFS
jgi:vacuolar-type H+-ATPase subunit E/Vma4